MKMIDIHRISLLDFEDTVYSNVPDTMAMNYINIMNKKNAYAWFYAVPIYKAVN